ncbi:MAG TPA: tetratricopeptide repeat protein [Gemmataceae bacterium]|nr:tetratricopeptide repeat protein [Gemmataceae bacterium]
MTQQLLVAFRPSLLRRTRIFLGSLILLTGLLALTAWNVTRSEALGQARQAYARGELTTCLRYSLDHLERRPWSREAALLAARCLSRLDFADAAEPHYERAGELDLNDLQIRAFGLVRGNHRLRAIQAYEQILARWPENVTALRRLAAVQLSENNIPQLEALAERLIRSPGGAAIGYTLRGVVAHNDKNREGAIAAFEHVLEVDPDLRLMPLPHQIFWSYLAEDLIKIGRTDEAGRYLTRVLNEAPDAPQHGLLDEAERCFQQAAEWEPDNYLSRYSLGKIELQRHRLEAARQHLEAARQLAPRQVDVLHSLGTVYRLLGQPAEADRIDRAISQIRERSKPARNPKDPWPRYAL